MKKHNSLGYLLAAAGTILFAVITAFVFGVLLRPVNTTPLGNEGEEIVQRTIEITNNGADSESIVKKIDSGLLSVGDYVATSFTGSDYLLLSKDDSEFAKDLSYVVYGNYDEASDIADELKDVSRKYMIDKLLGAEDPDYAFTEKLESTTGSRINSCEITKPLESDSGYTIGIRQVEGYCDIDGDEVRTDFYVDGVIYQATIKYDEESADKFKVSWDTSGVTEGLHEVKILLRSSDGRGFVAAGGEVLIPHCMQIADNGVSIGTLSEGTDSSWYALFVDEGDCYVNFVELSGDIKVSLYDIYGEHIGTNDMKHTSYEVLRGRAQDIPTIEEDTGIDGLTSVYYVLVSRPDPETDLTDDTADTDLPDKPLVTYTMVQSPNVAKYDGKVYAVNNCDLALPTPIPIDGNENNFSDREVKLTDINGNETTMTVGELSFLPINGFLNEFTLKDFARDEEIKLCPKFKDTEQYYGLYCDGNHDTICVEALPLEGYAATLTITCTSSIGTSEVQPGQSIALVPGENKIEVTVNSFTGTTRNYDIFILNGEDKEGFKSSCLKNFPTSYYSGLWLLHSLHPNYTFKAYNTGLDYYTVLDNEDNADRSLASDYSHPNWVVDSSPVYDGGGWRTAKNEVVSYFLDPRNFLSPKSIFSFELLSFDPSAQTVEGVQSMIKGSFMDDPSIDYATIIYNAGQTANVSPYFLASRILQEMGYQGQSLLCHGTLPGYEGYYNFYNIGSTPDPSIENGALINGAKYAMWGKDPDGKEITDEEKELMLPWDSVDKAITGGALWIASRYTTAGQDTLYFQKFDVIDNDDGLYQHQYAQNISMAYSEGLRYFDSYASIGMVDQSFVFVIPVYNNMPEDYGYLPDP
ncbi:MAG: hypothetical protein J6U54_14400 [Clostridiales bacterium]|nr:hypothetical protein [Clostridiales bacterium]